MSKVIVVTDSNSGITQSQSKELGVVVLPMPFYIDDKMYYEDIDLTQEQFYEKLTQGGEIKTSMPLVGDVTDKWDELLKEYDEIVYIPMSSGLSSSCETALMLAQDYEGKVEVVNNQRISVTQRQSVLDAKMLVEQGKSIMIESMKNDFEKRFQSPDGKKMHLEMAYTHDLEAAEAFKEEVQAAFPNNEIVLNPLSLSVSCHIGPGALAIACSKVIE